MQTVQESVHTLNEQILAGDILGAFERFYADDIVMQENESEPTVGKSACRAHEESFVGNITAFRGAAVKNVIISDDISVTEWHFDFDHALWGTRNYDQVAVQRWRNGQIVNEKFYYNN